MADSNQTERLVIERFAGIERLELDVKPFTVLIGPQSVGKSVVAKVLYALKSIPSALSFLVDPDVNRGGELGSLLNTYLCDQLGAANDAFLSYEAVEGMRITAESAPSDVAWEVVLPEPVARAYTDFVNHVTSDPIRPAPSVPSRIIPSLGTGSAFVPAGRSFYSQIERDFASFFKTASLDPFVSRFGSTLASLKNRRSGPVPPSNLPAAAAKELTEAILAGNYIREGNEDFIIAQDGRKVSASIWSSGQQEAQPLSFILQSCCQRTFRAGTLFIEEPEAHLFPHSQRAVTELISLAYRAARGEMRIFITTHSPYVLTTLNNLLLAGQLYKQLGATSPSEERGRLNGIVPEDRALDPAEVGVYYMDQTGCHSIMDAETGLIDASAIDAVSGSISDQFNALLELLPASA